MGEEVAKDLTEAVAFFRRAADSGHSFGTVLLGFCYKIGEGVEKDLTEVMRLFRKAVRFMC